MRYSLDPPLRELASQAWSVLLAPRQALGSSLSSGNREHNYCMVPVPWYCTGTGTGTGPGTGTGAGTGAGKAPVPVTGKAFFAKHDSAGRAAASSSIVFEQWYAVQDARRASHWPHTR